MRRVAGLGRSPGSRRLNRRVRIDLHTRPTASDGCLSPDALVSLAKENGVGVLAIADHDTTDGVDAAMRAGARGAVEVIPAVEINTAVNEAEVHVLGYCMDHRLPWFQEFLGRLRDGRVHRAAKMVEKLNALGVRLDFARVCAFAAGAVRRPHVGRGLGGPGGGRRNRGAV